jgi:hypothetical protein
MSKLKEIFMRMIAVCVATVLGTIGAGSLMGVDVWKSAGLAALLGCAVVLESLSRAYLSDGELSEKDINTAFQKVNSGTDEEEKI